MKQKDKKLLLVELCARLPYGVKVLDNSHKNYGVSKLINIGIDGSMLIDNEINDIQYYPIIDETKPYLRSMSSMTLEEYEDYNACAGYGNYEEVMVDRLEFLHKNHFDYRGLIEKGLAIEAPKNMYNS